MGVLEDLADSLAADTIKVMDRLSEDRLYEDVAKVIGESSTTLEEAFLTSMRIRLAERRGRRFLAKKIKTALPDLKKSAVDDTKK